MVLREAGLGVAKAVITAIEVAFENLTPLCFRYALLAWRGLDGSHTLHITALLIGVSRGFPLRGLHFPCGINHEWHDRINNAAFRFPAFEWWQGCDERQPTWKLNIAPSGAAHDSLRGLEWPSVEPWLVGPWRVSAFVVRERVWLVLPVRPIARALVREGFSCSDSTLSVLLQQEAKPLRTQIAPDGALDNAQDFGLSYLSDLKPLKVTDSDRANRCAPHSPGLSRRLSPLPS
jgi:hypothetical protein